MPTTNTSHSAARRPAVLPSAIAVAVLLLVATPQLGAPKRGGGLGPTPARAATPAPPPTEEADALAGAIAAPWPGRQRSSGAFPDYVAEATTDQRDPYGDAMLGYGLLQHGLREGDDGAVTAGLRAIGHALDTPVATKTRVFENLALASAYNLARRDAPDHPAFAGIRSRWQDHLRAITPYALGAPRPYYNWYLVEAVLWLELARSGLSSSTPGAVLADSDDAQARAARVVNDTAPSVAAASLRHSAHTGSRAILSDPPFNPLAYHALSSGLLARAVDILGGSASSDARRALDRAARASWTFAAPDGDLAYWGRSQEQSWALAATALAADTAARQDAAGAAGRFVGIGSRALARLRAGHLGGARGFAITPATLASPVAGIRGLDGYVAETPYVGWTLVTLNWMLEHGTGAPAPAEAIAADADGAFAHGRRAGGFVTVRSGDVWFAVKEGPAGRSRWTSYDRDARYDAGLVALKQRTGDTWRDVIPLRPKVALGFGAVGPSLRTMGRTARFEGTGLRLGADAKVTVLGGFRDARRRWVRRGVRLRYEPVACGVRMVLPTRRGDRFEQSLFFRSDGSGPDLSARRIADESQRVFTSRPARVSLGRRRLASGTDPAILRARVRHARATGRSLSVTICGPAS